MIVQLLTVFVLGAIFGSFLSVVIVRIRHQKKGILLGRSECPSCKKRLAFYDLIPIVSYLATKGKCRYCKQKIGNYYFWLEIITGLIFLAIFCKYPFLDFSDSGEIIFYSDLFFRTIFYGVVSLCLIGILFYDFLYMEIPELFTFPAMGLIVIATFLFPELDIKDMAIGGAIAAIFFGFQVWISKETWLGSGDTQVGIIMGLLLGWKLFIVSLVITYLLGTIISIPLLISKKLTGKSKIPFAPFMVTGTFIMIFFGEYLYDLYLQTLL